MIQVTWLEPIWLRKAAPDLADQQNQHRGQRKLMRCEWFGSTHKLGLSIRRGVALPLGLARQSVAEGVRKGTADRLYVSVENLGPRYVAGLSTVQLN